MKSANLTPCPLFIGGEWIRPSGYGSPVYNPSTGDVIAECPVGGAAEPMLLLESEPSNELDLARA